MVVLAMGPGLCDSGCLWWFGFCAAYVSSNWVVVPVTVVLRCGLR